MIAQWVLVFPSGKTILQYGLTRHQAKGVWGESAQDIQHLGFVIDTVCGTFGVPARK